MVPEAQARDSAAAYTIGTMILVLIPLILAAGASALEPPSGALGQLAGVAAVLGADSPPAQPPVGFRTAAVPVPAESGDPGALERLERAWRTKTSEGEASATASPSESDRRMVGHYVDVWAYLINKALRTGDREYLARNRTPLARLDLALERFPVFEGVVFRGSSHPPSVSLEPGAVLQDPAFVSTSRDFWIAEHYAGAAGYISVILTRSGRLLSYDKKTESLSEEREVLIPRSRSFRVIRFGEKYRGHEVVFLVEL